MTDFLEQLKSIGSQTATPIPPDQSVLNLTKSVDTENIDPLLKGGQASFEQLQSILSNNQRGSIIETDPIARHERKAAQRTPGETVSDSLRGFTGGLIGGTGALAGLAARGVDFAARQNGNLPVNPLFDNSKVLRNISEFTDDLSSRFTGTQSENLEFKRTVAEFEKADDIAASQNELEQDLKENRRLYNQENVGGNTNLGTGIAASLKLIGRDKLAQGRRVLRDGIIGSKNLASNPSVAGDIAAQGLGSLIPSLVGSGGSAAAARAVLSKTAFKQGAKDKVEQSVTALAVGGIEGQGAYNSTVSRINQFDEEQLRAGSSDYVKLREQGLSHEDARHRIADLAGNHAQKIQTIIATGAGFGVAKFEANPFNSGSALSNVVTQTIEEAFQSGSGELTSNIGVKKFADRNQEISEGIGEAAAEGAVGGLGATAVITSPQAAKSTVKAAGEGGKAALRHAGPVLEFLAEARTERNNPSGNSATTKRISSLEETITKSQDDRLPLHLVDTQSQDYVDSVGSLKEDIVEGSRIKTLRRVTEKIRRDRYKNPEQKAEAQAFVKNEVRALREYVTTNQAEGSGEVETATAKTIELILDNKSFNSVVTEDVQTQEDPIIQEVEQAIQSPDVNEADTQSLTTLKEVLVSPVSVDPVKAAEVLENDYQGTPAETAAFKVAAAITPVEQSTEGTGTDRKTRGDVRNELVFSDETTSYGSLPSFNELVSNVIKGGIKQERAGITEVVDSRGNSIDAKDSAIRLGNLAQHQINKFNAAIESLKSAVPEQDTKVQFETLDPRTGDTFLPIQKGNSVFINPGSEQSLETLNQIREDANLGIAAHNAVIEQFGEVFPGQKLNPIPEIDNAIIEEARARSTQESTGTPQEAETQGEAPVRDASQDSGRDSNPVDTDRFNISFDDGDVSLNQNLDTSSVSAERLQKREETKRRVKAEPTAVTPKDSTPEVSDSRSVDTAVGSNLVKGVGGSSIIQNTFEDISPKLTADQDLVETISEELGEQFTAKDKKTLNNHLGEVIRVRDGLTAKIKKELSSKTYNTPNGIRTWLEVLQEGQIDLTSQRRGRALGLLTGDSVSDGNIEFDEHLINLALLATLDYTLNEDTSGGFKDLDDANKQLGLPDDAIPTLEQLSALNFGKAEFHIKEELARNIKEFWGATDNKGQSTSFTKGIPEAIADEILGYFTSDVENPWFDTLETTIGSGENKRSYVSTRTNKDNIAEAGDLNSNSILRDVFAPEIEGNRYLIGEKLKASRIPVNQKKNKNVLVGENQQAAIKRQQETPSYRAQSFIEDVQFLSGDNNSGAPLAEYLGSKVITDPEKYNVYDLETIKGKNRSIQRNIEDVAELLAGIEAHKQDNPAVYFTYFTSSNNRFFQEGPNQQTNKLLRETVVPNTQTIDITPGAKTLEIAYAAIAQAFGVKIENEGLTASAAEARVLIDGKYADVIQAFRDGDAKAFNEAIAVGGFERNPKELKAISTAVRLQDALSAGETTFKSELSLEVDAKTNGPITAFFQNTLGGFNKNFVALAARGGVYFGDVAKTYAEYVGSPKSADYYEVVAQEQTRQVKDLNTDIRDNNPKYRKEILGTQVGILSLLNTVGGIRFQPGTSTVDAQGKRQTSEGALVIQRKGTKGAITQQVYGAGNSSIAKGLSKSIMSRILEEASDVIQGKDPAELDAMLVALNKAVAAKVDNRTDDVSQWSAKPSREGIHVDTKNPEALQKLLFDQSLHKVLSKNIEALYVKPFSNALENVLGSRTASSLNNPEPGNKDRENNLDTLLRDFQEDTESLLDFTGINSVLVSATNAHNDIYLAVVKNLISAATERYRKVNGQGLELPQAELDKILASAQKFAPVYDNGNSSFQLGSSETETTGDVDARRREQPKGERESTFGPRSQRLDESKSSSRRRVPSKAGVAALPNNVISNADVKIITDVINGLKKNVGVIAVHDGIETGLNDVEHVSLLANEAALASFQTNTIKPILESLQGLKQLEEVAIKRGASTELFLEVDAAVQILQTASNIRDARIHALNTVQKSSDAVPGAESPFLEAEGEVFTSEQSLVDHLEKEYQKARNRQVEGKPLQDVEIESSPELRNKLEAASDTKDFIKILGDNINNPDQRAVFNQISNSAALQDALDSGLSVVMQDTGNVGGSYNLSTNTLNISNATAETVLHELVHAATAHQVQEHYNNPESTSERGKAVKRLESLMADFNGRTYKKGSVERIVQSEIQKGLDLKTPEGQMQALNEFMAWSLSNEKLIADGKKKVANDPRSQLKALSRRVLGLMRRILGFTSNKVFDHVLFNTSIILNNSETSAANAANINAVRDIVLNQRLENNAAPINPRIAYVSEMFENLFRNYIIDRSAIVQNSSGSKSRELAATDEALRSREALDRVQQAGIEFESVAAESLFKQLALSLSLDLNTNRTSRLDAQEVYEAVTSKLTPEDFLKLQGLEYTTASQSQTEAANKAYAALIGLPFESNTEAGKILKPEIDFKGNSNQLGVFLALAQTSEQVRDVLDSLKIDDLLDPKTDPIERITRVSLSSLAGKVLEKSSEEVTATEGLDIVTERLLEEDINRTIIGEAGIARIFGAADRFTRGALDSVAGAATNSENIDGLAEELSKTWADGVTGALNNSRVPHFIRNLWGEIRGIVSTKETNPEGNEARTPNIIFSIGTDKILSLVKSSKNLTAQIRQRYVEELPQILEQKFSEDFGKKDTRKETKAEKKRLYQSITQAFVRANAVALQTEFGTSRTLSLFGSDQRSKSRRQRAADKIRTDITTSLTGLSISPALQTKVVNLLEQKIDQLIQFDASGTAGVNLLTSAEAIAGLYNTTDAGLTPKEYSDLQKALKKHRLDENVHVSFDQAHQGYVKQVGLLLAVKRADALSDVIQDDLRALSTTETKGLTEVLTILKDLNQKEINKTDLYQAKINGYAGGVTTQSASNSRVILASSSDQARLLRAGYSAIPNRSGVTIDGIRHDYFQAPFDKKSSFNQGVLQTIRQTYNGVNPVTGATEGAGSLGLIYGGAAKHLNRRLKRGEETGHNYRPLFTEYGDVYAYEVLTPSGVNTQLNETIPAHQLIGQRAGRVVEEQESQGINESLMDALFEAWDNREIGSDDQFVALDETSVEFNTDPVFRDAVRLIPKSASDYGNEVFSGPIRIRKDLINNSLGFRSAAAASVVTGADAIKERTNDQVKASRLRVKSRTPNGLSDKEQQALDASEARIATDKYENSRLNPEVKKALEDIATIILGSNAKKYLTVAEDVISAVVSEVKHTIVVKSGVISVANELSNNLQLLARGIPISVIAQEKKAKFVELRQYTKDQDRLIELETLRLGEKNITRKASIQSQIDRIVESHRRMSIWPLLEAGEYTTISDGLTGLDRSKIQGDYISAIEEAVDNLPDGIRNVGKYALLTKDTKAYQILSSAVQFSDFLSKAVYYEHLINQGESQADALTSVTSEFINYDLLDGRSRSYMEQIGITWFMNFKIRSLKVAMSLIHKNPVTALTLMGGLSQLDIGTVLGDNAVAAWLDGRLGYSIGPGMLEAGWSLNIWNQIFSH